MYPIARIRNESHPDEPDRPWAAADWLKSTCVPPMSCARHRPATSGWRVTREARRLRTHAEHVASFCRLPLLAQRLECSPCDLAVLGRATLALPSRISPDDSYDAMQFHHGWRHPPRYRRPGTRSARKRGPAPPD